MKQIIKITTVICMLLYCGIIYSQEDNNEYIRSIEDALSKDECAKAKERYQWYIDDGGIPVRELENRIADCGKIDTIAEPSIQLIDSTNVKTQEMDEIEIRDNEDLPVIEITPIEEPGETPVTDTSEKTIKPISTGNKRHFLIMPGMAAGDPLSYSLTVGFLTGKWGGYAKVKSNFASKGDAITGGPDDAFYVDGFSKKGRFSVSAGVTGQVADILLIYAGIGYGSKWVQWKTSSRQLITIDTQSFSAIDPELGLIFKTGNFLIGAGVSALLGTQTAIEANLSIGLIF